MRKYSPCAVPGGLLLGMVVPLLFHTGPAHGAITGWDFQDGTLQGWTNVSVSTTGPLQYTAQTNGGDVTWLPWGYRTTDTGYMAAVEAFAVRDDAQDAPLVLRSPTFQLASGGAISVHVLGGVPGDTAITPANFSDVSGPSLNTSGEDPGGDASYLGVALRRDSDGAYLLTRERTSTGSGYSNWQNLLFTEADLAPIMAANLGELFTLDVIDTAHGRFGSLAVDGVSIPVASPSNIFQGGGMWHVQERLSAGEVNNLADAEALFALPADDPGVLAEVTTDVSVVNFYDFLSSPGRFEGDDLFLAGQLAFATRVTGNIHITEGGPVTFGFHANDGGILRVNGQVVAQDNFPDIATDTFGTINLVAGVHAVDFIYFQDGAGASVELFAATTTGEFTSLAGANWDLLVATDMPLPEGIPGDYNNDHVVDARDYVVWRNALDTATVLPNDTTPGVTIDDYDVWRQHFGMSSPGGGALLSPAQVPEPSTLAVVSGALGLAWGARRRFRKARQGN